VNYVRLRLWVDPQSRGQGYGGGDNDLATTLALAKRAKAQG
jgi:arabinogalactan endo-1,4-beta-galactosidase